MSEVRCKLCNKQYDHHYALFGRGCLENLFYWNGERKRLSKSGLRNWRL